ncbi:hypothetical protein [Streptomyces sp. Root66D1]|nr:hypothetical protein [Streptomyces sp. Root66D1]
MTSDEDNPAGYVVSVFENGEALLGTVDGTDPRLSAYELICRARTNCSAEVGSTRSGPSDSQPLVRPDDGGCVEDGVPFALDELGRRKDSGNLDDLADERCGLPHRYIPAELSHAAR